MANDVPAIGIDLGTTYSCVAVFQHGQVEIIPNDCGSRTTPSYVVFTDSGISVGDSAKNLMAINPSNTVFSVKRLIGRNFQDPIVQNDMRLWPFEVINDGGRPKVQVANAKGERKVFFPEQISAMILVKMKEAAEAFLGQRVTNAVITVPAYFKESQRQATIDAGKIAGLNVLRIINEPTAAAIAYGFKNNQDGKERKVLIFDLGGGTFDVSIMDIKDSVFKVLAIAGDTHLGGEDFDDRMVNYFIEEIKRRYRHDLSPNKRALRRLRTACEQAKRTLSSLSEASVAIDSLFEGADFYSTITRARFEELNSDFFRSTIAQVQKALHDAKLNPSDIQEVVLVGGSTRIPKVQNLLQELFYGKELNKSIHPDEAVAYGAAVLAARMTSQYNPFTLCLNNLLLIDVAPFSLGVRSSFVNMSTIIRRNTPIPTIQKRNFTTTSDYQTSVVIMIYEGESKMTIDNNLLGNFVLNGIPPAPRGVAKIEITFNMNSEGILNVSATERSTGSTNRITITNIKDRLSQHEIQQIISEVQRFQSHDQNQLERVEVKNALESFCYNMKSTIENEKFQLMLTDKQKNDIIEQCTWTVNWLGGNQPATVDIEQRRIQMEQMFLPVVNYLMSQGSGNVPGTLLSLCADSPDLGAVVPVGFHTETEMG